MKKLAIFMMLIIIAICCMFAFSACEEDDNVSVLAIDKRYILANDVKKEVNKQDSYVFHFDGTGEYTLHYDYILWDEANDEKNTHNHYKIHFKYTYVDGDKSAVVCFYDNIERLEGDNGKANPTDWSALLTVSKNVLATAGSYGYVFWINEDYLKAIPNFGKQTA